MYKADVKDFFMSRRHSVLIDKCSAVVEEAWALPSATFQNA